MATSLTIPTSAPTTPTDRPPKQFRSPVHCAEISNDGLVYTCDRANDRIQVFNKDGSYVKEAFIARETRGGGSAWDIAFSKDPEQTYIFLADGQNSRVHILLRDTLEELTNFGDGGRQPGQFFGVHNVALDSKATCIHPRPSKQAPAEVRLQGPGTGNEERPRRRLANKVERAEGPGRSARPSRHLRPVYGS